MEAKLDQLLIILSSQPSCPAPGWVPNLANDIISGTSVRRQSVSRDFTFNASAKPFAPVASKSGDNSVMMDKTSLIFELDQDDLSAYKPPPKEEDCESLPEMACGNKPPLDQYIHNPK